MAYLTTGVAAMRMGMRYHTLVRAVRGRDDLPGVIRVGVNAGFDPDRLAELRVILVAEGWMAEEVEHLVPTAGAECLA